MDIQNAIISSAVISFADRGFLDCWLTFDYGQGGCQGFGGYTLYLPKSWRHHSVLSPAGHFIYRSMEIAGVDSWDKMKGRSIRVRGDVSKVSAIGNIIKEDWFCPSEDFAHIQKEKGK